MSAVQAQQRYSPDLDRGLYLDGHSEIIGVGAYFPEKRVSSEELMARVRSERFGISHEWMNRAMGIHERRYAAAGEPPSDLAVAAARQAIERAGIQPQDIQVVIFAGIDGDHCEPGTAHWIQERIGAKRAICRDTRNACHGFIDGLQQLDMLIAGGVECGLVVTGECQSRGVLDWIPKMREIDEAGFRLTLGLLSVGDGGGAMVLSAKNPGRGFRGFHIHSDGAHADLCHYKWSAGGITGQMLMREICTEIHNMHTTIYPRTMSRLAWRPSMVDWLVTHQVGEMPFRRLGKAAGVSAAKMTRTFPNFGNLTTATFPANFDILYRSGDLKPGNRILGFGTGSGLTVSQFGYIW